MPTAKPRAGLTPQEKAEMLRWARRALHGIEESAVFVGLLDDRPMDAARVEFTLQLGHCILTNKPIILPVPHVVAVPAKLAAVADAIVRYDPVHLDSLQFALEKVLTEFGVKKQ